MTAAHAGAPNLASSTRSSQGIDLAIAKIRVDLNVAYGGVVIWYLCGRSATNLLTRQTESLAVCLAARAE
jgi:hypothetical protein